MSFNFCKGIEAGISNFYAWWHGNCTPDPLESRFFVDFG
jgi:hypothetical protein